MSICLSLNENNCLIDSYNKCFLNYKESPSSKRNVCTHYDRDSGKKVVVDKCKGLLSYDACISDSYCRFNYQVSPSINDNVCTHIRSKMNDKESVEICKLINSESKCVSTKFCSWNYYLKPSEEQG